MKLTHAITVYCAAEIKCGDFLNFALYAATHRTLYTWSDSIRYPLNREGNVPQNWSARDGQDKFVPMGIEPQPYNP